MSPLCDLLALITLLLDTRVQTTAADDSSAGCVFQTLWPWGTW